MCCAALVVRTDRRRPGVKPRVRRSNAGRQYAFDLSRPGTTVPAVNHRPCKSRHDSQLFSVRGKARFRHFGKTEGTASDYRRDPAASRAHDVARMIPDASIQGRRGEGGGDGAVRRGSDAGETSFSSPFLLVRSVCPWVPCEKRAKRPRAKQRVRDRSGLACSRVHACSPAFLLAPAWSTAMMMMMMMLLEDDDARAGPKVENERGGELGRS